MSVIVLAGMIGAGKSTYTKMIAEELGTEAFYESVDDNRILELFYADAKRWAFSLQIHFLNTRFKSIKEAFSNQNNVLDRSIYEDALFTKINYIQGNMSEAEFDTYISLLDNMMEELDGMKKKSPDLLIYLDGSFEAILKRISKRGRSFEQVEENPELLEYYKLLHQNYEEWYQNYDKSPKMKINIDIFDIVDNPQDKEDVMSLIRSQLLCIESNNLYEKISKTLIPSS